MNLHQLAKEGEFCCNDGLCIQSEKRCDNAVDCIDHSDEKECPLVRFPDQYNIQSPPVQSSIQRFSSEVMPIVPTVVEAFIDVHDIIDVKEVASEISIQFAITLKWKDSRLDYLYLKQDIEKNIIEDEIWIPKIDFPNLKEYIRDSMVIVEVSREGPMTSNPSNELTMQEIYSGSDNTLILEAAYQNKFICSFEDIKEYPFDVEICTIEIAYTGSNYDLVDLTPVGLKYLGRSSIGQYTLKNTEFIKKPEANYTILQMEFHLGRDFRSIFAVTLLPTILMNIINQSTNFLDTSRFLETIITVNITCMMVLSALYISVSTSLPATSNIKYIDIWLLYSLVFPFLIILINLSLYYAKKLEGFTVKVKPARLDKETSLTSTMAKFNTARFIRAIALYVNPLIYISFIIGYLIFGINFL